MPMNAIFVLEPNGQSLLSLLRTLAPPGGHFPGTPHCLHVYKPSTSSNKELVSHTSASDGCKLTQFLSWLDSTRDRPCDAQELSKLSSWLELWANFFWLNLISAQNLGSYPSLTSASEMGRDLTQEYF